VLRFLAAVWARINSHNLSLAAAGIAFWALLALFPGLGVLLGAVALVFDPAKISRELTAATGLLPPEAAELLSKAVAGALPAQGTPLTFAVVASLAFALWSARYAISALMGALDTSFDVEERRSFVKQEITALMLTLCAIVATIFALGVIAVLPFVEDLLPEAVGRNVIAPLARWPLLGLLMVLGVSLLYRFGPDRPAKDWRLFSPGAIAATLMWLAGSALFTLYVARFNYYSAMYGSLGAVVVLLLWLWISALAVLIGAEVDAVLSKRPLARWLW
jgi:membrane protein